MFPPGPGPDAVKLTGGQPGTTNFLYRRPDDTLVIELYDYSKDAERCFGNDVAFLIHIDAKYKSLIFALLHGSEHTQRICADSELFACMRERFRDYHEAQRWLDANDIPYQKEFDSRA